MKKILITGKNSYIGTSFEKWLAKEPDKYQVNTVATRNEEWKELDFSPYDVVFHVAAIVHKKENKGLRDTIFRVNRDLAVEIAKKAKKAGVSQFIFMSTMAVYGEIGEIGKQKLISKHSHINPQNYYATSKAEAEIEIKKLENEKFKIVVIRPPMVYGPNCPGNYAKLYKIAKKTYIFPYVDNFRSVIHIDMLCDSIQNIVDKESIGLYLPQDDDYICTSKLVFDISNTYGKKIYLSKFLGKVITTFLKNVPMVRKVFGNLAYYKD